MQYRPEIDGLRTIAVVPVILFHAGFSAFGGGFAGVDVFFVISGYLITGILLKELQDDRFRLINFYERRARRILPALFFIMALCLPFAWMWLRPEEMQDFAQSLIAVSTFSSNFLFWQESGYFERTAELKPLLHTWSLAVEEQYYILFPLFLMAAWRFGVRPILIVLALVFCVSLFLGHWSAVYRGGYSAFFLLPTRGWELLAGAFVAFYEREQRPLPVGVSAQNFLSLLGLSMIGMTIFVYTGETPFPSLYTLLPVLGSVLIIVFARAGTLVHWLLSRRGMVGIGLISYSAYLWHHPLFAFTKIQHLGHPSAATMLALCVLTFPLAYFSWRFIEQPFRDKAKISRNAVFRASVAGASLFSVIGLSGHLSNGFEKQMLAMRFDAAQMELYELIKRETKYNMYDHMVDDSECRFWTRQVSEDFERRFDECRQQYGQALVILGDSHAMNIYNIAAKSKVGPFIVGVARGGCRPHDNEPECHYDGFDDFSARHRDSIGHILFHQSGSHFILDVTGKADSTRSFDENQFEVSTDRISRNIRYLNRLQNLTGAPVTWLGPFREYRHHPIDAVYNPKFLQVHPNSTDVFGKLEHVLGEVFQQENMVSSIGYVPFADVTELPLHALQGQCYFYRDTDHFTRCGEDMLASSFKAYAMKQGWVAQ